jgi:hypothetical protein
MLLNGTPEYLRSDNGPEFTAKKIRKWLEIAGVTTTYIELTLPPIVVPVPTLAPIW